MTPEIWAAVIGSLVLVVFTGVGVVTWSHLTRAQTTADEALRCAHAQQVRFLEYVADAGKEFVREPRLESILENMSDQLREINRKLDNKVDKGSVPHHA
jgi:hypothetical protein